LDEITLTRPDDWHLHLRDGAMTQCVAGYSAGVFGRAIIMPNLKPPVTDVEAARAYRERIRAAIDNNTGFQPLMTLYLTDNTTPETIAEAAACGFIHGIKLYPAGATTNSDAGVTDLARCHDSLAAMAEHGLPLLVHGEVTGQDVDIFDREAVFLEQRLAPLLESHPTLRVVLEHVTTARATDFVRQGPARLAATITAHHLLLNRNDMLVGGIRPHHYCLPVLKRERDRAALIEAATSGNPKFFLGTDSAPHPRGAKVADCGCAGVFSAPTALPAYAEAFDAAGGLDRLEGFASHFGPDFYGLPRNAATLTLRRHPWSVPETLPAGDDVLVPLRAGEEMAWQVVAGS
jgi:dihydroorotase